LLLTSIRHCVDFKFKMVLENKNQKVHHILSFSDFKSAKIKNIYIVCKSFLATNSTWHILAGPLFG
jgi:uncharacterized protein (UPF0262 family)